MAPRWTQWSTLAAAWLFAPSAWAATVHVDGNSTDPVQDGSIEHPFHSVASGLDAAAAGDTIDVAAGIYPEALTIDKAVTIVGAPRLRTVIEPMDSWHLDATGVELRSLAFVGLGTGTAIEASRPFSLSDSQIQDFTIGLRTYGVAGNTSIVHNRLVGNRNGIVLTNSGGANYIGIENNLILGTTSGVGLRTYDSRFRAYHNAIVDQYVGLYSSLGSGVNLPISYARNNLVVAARAGIYGYNVDEHELKVWANAVEAPLVVGGITPSDELWTIESNCGVTLGAQWDHGLQPTGDCIDAGVFAADPDGTPPDIGLYGGPQAGPVSAPWWQDFGCRGSDVFCPAEAVAAWLAPRPEVRASMVFYDEDQWSAYDGWTDRLRVRFEDRVTDAWYGIEDPMAYPPPNLADPGPTDPGFGVHAYEATEDLYLSNAAHSFVTELQGRVPWSLDDYNADELNLLFDGQLSYTDSPACFGGVCTPEGVGLRVLNSYFAAPGDATWAFGESQLGVGADRVETIANALEWSRSNMSHHFGSLSQTQVYDYHWGYAGPIPHRAVMDGHDPVGNNPTNPSPIGLGFSHWTAGCHGTNLFLQAALRPLNIPVEYVRPHHALPHFPSEGLWLSHGDDPYSALSKADFPAELLLIDDATHQQWFVDAPNAGIDNVGRRPRELAAEYLPLFLQNYRCNDLEAGLSKSEGSVGQLLEPAYTLAELDALGFWAALDAEIDSAGLCNVPLPLGSG